MEDREPKKTPEPTYEEQPAAQEASVSFPAQTDKALNSAVASLAMAMAGFVEPNEADALNEAAATLMEGGEDGNA